MNATKRLFINISAKKELSRRRSKDSNFNKNSKRSILSINGNYINNKYNLTKNITINKFNDQKLLLLKKEKEIQTLKLENEKLEKEKQKYQQQNKILKTISSNISKYKKNNTSSNFPMVSEIKKIWEKFAKIDLLNNFIDYENEPELIYNILCEIILLSDKMIKECRLMKYQQILKIIGVYNSNNVLKDFELQFKTFMKEHLNETFKDLKSQKFINDYKMNLKNNISKINFKSDNSNYIRISNELIENFEFIDMLNNINDIILFTQFNDPILYFNIEPDFQKRKLTFITIDKQNKNNFIIINNNGENKLNCIILLKPPCLKSNLLLFNELKPIVLIINDNKKVSNNIFFDSLDKFSESYISNENNSNNKNNNSSIDDLRKNLIYKNHKISNISKNIFSDCDFSSADTNVKNNNTYTIDYNYIKKQKNFKNKILFHIGKSALERKISSNLNFNSFVINENPKTKTKTKTRTRTLSLNIKKDNYDNSKNFFRIKTNPHKNIKKIQLIGNKNKRVKNKTIKCSTNFLRKKNEKYLTETEINSKNPNNLYNKKNCKINNFNINYINIINSYNYRYKNINSTIYDTIEEIKKMIDENIHKSISMFKNRSMFREYSNIKITSKSNRMQIKNKMNNSKINNILNTSYKNNKIINSTINNNRLTSFPNKTISKNDNRGNNKPVVNKIKNISKKTFTKSQSNKNFKILFKKNFSNNQSNKYYKSISNLICKKLYDNTFNSQKNILNIIPQINRDKKHINKNYYSFVNGQDQKNVYYNDGKKTRINILNINSLKKKDK